MVPTPNLESGGQLLIETNVIKIVSIHNTFCYCSCLKGKYVIVTKTEKACLFLLRKSHVLNLIRHLGELLSIQNCPHQLFTRQANLIVIYNQTTHWHEAMLLFQKFVQKRHILCTQKFFFFQLKPGNSFLVQQEW